jgi:hypothetical protein
VALLLDLVMQSYRRSLFLKSIHLRAVDATLFRRRRFNGIYI